MQDVLIQVQEKERGRKTITPIYCHLIGKDKQESYNKVKSQTCFVWLLVSITLERNTHEAIAYLLPGLIYRFTLVMKLFH